MSKGRLADKVSMAARVAYAQVSGLTKLLEGQKEATVSGSAGGGRKENRRETWCPGASGGAYLGPPSSEKHSTQDGQAQIRHHMHSGPGCSTIAETCGLCAGAGGKGRKRAFSAHTDSFAEEEGEAEAAATDADEPSSPAHQRMRSVKGAGCAGDARKGVTRWMRHSVQRNPATQADDTHGGRRHRGQWAERGQVHAARRGR